MCYIFAIIASENKNNFPEDTYQYHIFINRKRKKAFWTIVAKVRKCSKWEMATLYDNPQPRCFAKEKHMVPSGMVTPVPVVDWISARC